MKYQYQPTHPNLLNYARNMHNNGVEFSDIMYFLSKPYKYEVEVEELAKLNEYTVKHAAITSNMNSIRQGRSYDDCPKEVQIVIDEHIGLLNKLRREYHGS